MIGSDENSLDCIVLYSLNIVLYDGQSFAKNK